MKYKCVIFDCDGVLVDTEALSFRVLEEMVVENGLNVDVQYAAHAFAGKALKLLFQHMEEVSGKRLPEDFEQQFRDRTFGAFASDLQAIPGVREVIEGLQVPYCVASSGPIHKMELTLGTTDLLKYFEGHLYSAYQIQKWKPDPDIFLYAAREMGFAPSDCAVIEDSIAGVKAGIAGGFDVFGYVAPEVDRGMVARLKAVGATVFGDMAELPALLTD